MYFINFLGVCYICTIYVIEIGRNFIGQMHRKIILFMVKIHFDDRQTRINLFL